ncbi:thiamine phosphate synthase [Telmatobacter bradus]|uniref:thiamine phosphate synthase n=1 Tax=Telmatobacter bradus TaxID=474953 RepID=UPI003B437DFE
MSTFKLNPRLRRGLYLVMTRPRDGYECLCACAVEAGISAVQLRIKNHDAQDPLLLARRLRELTRGSSTLFIVNDSPEIAMESDADGLHIGQQDISAVEARKIIGPEKLLGLSTHNLEQIKAANDAPVDYIGFGPLYLTNSKACPDPVIGPEMLEAAYQSSTHPIVAIGGLNLERIQKLGPYAHNVAVIRAVSEAPDPLTTMREIQAAFLLSSSFNGIAEPSLRG